MASAPPLDVSVVLPTYDEADNLPRIIPEILQQLADADITGEVIVVDDDSPDGTARVAHELAQQHSVRVIHRTEERGLATAVLAGFALSEATVCVVMDADGSHPVARLPEMVRAILDDKSDIAVGSRHVAGGGMGDWPLFSQLKSKFAASMAFGLTTMTDPTTGFMAIRRDRLDGLELDPIGWKIVLEIVVKAHPARVTEVPIVFNDRFAGESKQSLAVLLQYMTHCYRLYCFRYPGLLQFIKFCVVGLSGVAVDLGVVLLVVAGLGWDARLAAAVAFSVAVSWNYAINRRFSFPEARQTPLLPSYFTYVAANSAGLLVRLTTVHLLMAMFGLSRAYLVTNLVGIALATFVNFIGAKYFAFAPERMAFGTATDSEQRSTAVAGPWPLAAVVAAGGAVATWFTATRPLTTGDEGANAVMGMNIARTFELFVHPSYAPLGTSNWAVHDAPTLGNLPVYPALLALVSSLGGASALGFVSLAAYLASIIATSVMFARWDRTAGWIVATLMATAPALHRAFGLVEFEPVLVGCASSALALIVTGNLDRARWKTLAGGVLLGVAFLIKLWLVLPLAVATFGFYLLRARGDDGSHARSDALMAYGACIVTSALHLAFIASWSSADLSFWVKNVYLGIFSGHGVTGAKLSGIERYAGAGRPFWYYPLVLYRQHFYLLPLCVYGIAAWTRRFDQKKAVLVALLTGSLLGAIALSVPAFKEPLYVLSLAPLLYGAAALCLSAAWSTPKRYRRIRDASARVGITLAVVLSLAMLGGHVLGVVSRQFVVTHAAGMAVSSLVGIALLRRQPLIGTVCAVGVGMLVIAAGQSWQAPTPPHRAVAAAIAPHIEGGDVHEPRFAATAFRPLQAYTFRHGYPLQETVKWAPPSVVVFVITPDDRRYRKRAAEWLAKHCATLADVPIRQGRATTIYGRCKR